MKESWRTYGIGILLISGMLAALVWASETIEIATYVPAPTPGATINVPIGSIIAWHKSMTGTPALPAGWVECNGQVLNDPDSPCNGQTIPNLNAAAGYSGGRFLRGGSISGTMQAATSHLFIASHPGLPFAYIATTGYNGSPNADGYFGGTVGMDTYSSSNPNSYPHEQGFASRPVNMSVVWIMRVK